MSKSEDALERPTGDTSAPGTRPNAVADVATERAKEIVELVSKRDASEVLIVLNHPVVAAGDEPLTRWDGLPRHAAASPMQRILLPFPAGLRHGCRHRPDAHPPIRAWTAETIGRAVRRSLKLQSRDPRAVSVAGRSTGAKLVALERRPIRRRPFHLPIGYRHFPCRTALGRIATGAQLSSASSKALTRSESGPKHGRIDWGVGLTPVF